VRVERCDLLVIGAGGAGLRAALAARESNPALKVMILTKGELGRSGVTATACSDRMAFHATLPTSEPRGPDAWRYHAGDIFRLGGFVSDEDLAEILARDSARAFEYLDSLGVPFVRRQDGQVDQFLTDGSDYPRACYTGPYTANHIEEALIREVRREDLQVVERSMAVSLLLADGGSRVAGVLALPQEGGEPWALTAGAVLLATGGAGQVYATNVFPADCTGDGYALAYQAGAELLNLEFVQIGLSSIRTRLACSGSMFRALPRLVNDRGDEFLSKYVPHDTSPARILDLLFSKGASWPVSYEAPSHVIDIAVYYERAAGRKVYMGFGDNPAGLDAEALAGKISNWYQEVKGCDLAGDGLLESPLARLQAINRPAIDWLAERGVDLRGGDLLELAPAAQHFQGGVRIRQRGDTTLPGLFAAGETAGGQHGANRPGGNALLDGQVFGRIAGEEAAAWAEAHPPGRSVEVDGALRFLHSLDTAEALPASEVRARLGELMDLRASVVRTPAGLEAGLEDLQHLKEAGIRADEKGLAYAVEAFNLLQVAEMVLMAARAREESRGPHLLFGQFGNPRPLPGGEERWHRYLVIRKVGPEMKLEAREPITTGNSVT